MIPKVIHYCWFGNSNRNSTLKMCRESWDRNLPDYKIKLWNETNSPIQHPFVRRMLDQKKWAYVSDYVRLHALYTEGGLYLDTDMEVLRNLDCFLDNQCFLGFEDETNISAGIIGCEPKSSFMRECMEFYDSLIDPINIPSILTHIFSSNRSTNKLKVTLYPPEYFYPWPYKVAFSKSMLKENSFTIHHWQHSWKLSLMERFKNKFRFNYTTR